MTTHLIFGYGSLVNFQSAAQTIGRHPVLNDNAFIARAHDLERNWEYWQQVKMESGDIRPLRFLSISTRRGYSCNGIVFEVNDDELKQLDAREQQYRRVEVYATLENCGPSRVFAYLLDACSPPAPYVARISSRYIDIVEKGTKALGDDFSIEFWRSTLFPSAKYTDERYSFIDPSQRKAAGTR